MPANIYLKNKKTKTVSGPGCAVTLADIDNYMRKDLGEPEDSQNWLGRWDENIQFHVAMNADPRDLVDGCLQIPLKYTEARNRRWQILNYLARNYLFGNNHGSVSRYRTKREEFIDILPLIDARRTEWALQSMVKTEDLPAGATS